MGALAVRTALGLKHAFVNQPVEVSPLQPQLASLAGMPGRRPDIVMRFGYGPTLPFSPRRPVEAVLSLMPDRSVSTSLSSIELEYWEMIAAGDYAGPW